jgi:hypothetical protein
MTNATEVHGAAIGRCQAGRLLGTEDVSTADSSDLLGEEGRSRTKSANSIEPLRSVDRYAPRPRSTPWMNKFVVHHRDRRQRHAIGLESDCEVQPTPSQWQGFQTRRSCIIIKFRPGIKHQR